MTHTRWPDFTAAHIRRLEELGVTPGQVAALRDAFPAILLAVAQPAARNDVLALLRDVERLSSELSRRIEVMHARIDPAHAHANALIEVAYFGRLKDDAAFVAAAFVPRLRALRDSASAAAEAMPKSPARRRTADARPVGAIADALVRGWSADHPSRLFRVTYEGDREVRHYVNPDAGIPPPLPVRFLPSASDGARGNVFREVVGICYDACGGNPDPVAAIKAYLRMSVARREALLALERGIAEANRRNRTSRKK